MSDTTPADTLLEFRDVAMQFDEGVTALAGVDLTVRRGEVVTVVGPSGCGTSALLRIGSGPETTAEGTASLSTSCFGSVFQDEFLDKSITFRRPSAARRRLGD